MSRRRGPAAGRTDVTVRESEDTQGSNAEARGSAADASKPGAPEPPSRPEAADFSIAQRPTVLDD